NVSISDSGGTANGGSDTSALQSFEITVLPVNQAPTFVGGDNVLVIEDSGAHSFTGWVSDFSAGPSNESEQKIEWLIEVDRPELFAVLPQIDENGNLSFEVASNAYGVAEVRVFAVDDGGLSNGGEDTSAAYTFSIELAPVNDVPTFIIGNDVDIATGSTPRVIENWIQNVNVGPGEAGTQSVVFLVDVDRPEAFEVLPKIDENGSLSFTLNQNAVGEVVLTVRVRDDGGVLNGGVDTSLPQTATLNIINATPPSIGSGQDGVWWKYNTLVEIPIDWSVGEGLRGTVEIVDGPDWISLSENGELLTGIPLRGDPSAERVLLRVSDGIGRTAELEVFISLYRKWAIDSRWLEDINFGRTTSDLPAEEDSIEISITAALAPEDQ
ncbi:MAG: hypothetical protein AAGB06_03240, partial [Verrucomicrobiota bacterium]